MATDTSSMTLFKARKIVSVNYTYLEDILGDRVDEFVTKKVDLKGLEAEVAKHRLPEDILSCVLTEDSDLTFTIRALKAKGTEDL
jgi:hypothetical protein